MLNGYKLWKSACCVHMSLKCSHVVPLKIGSNTAVSLIYVHPILVVVLHVVVLLPTLLLLVIYFHKLDFYWWGAPIVIWLALNLILKVGVHELPGRKHLAIVLSYGALIFQLTRVPISDCLRLGSRKMWRYNLLCSHIKPAIMLFLFLSSLPVPVSLSPAFRLHSIAILLRVE